MDKDVPPIIDAHAEVVHDPSAQTADQPDAFSDLVQNLVSKALLIGIVVIAGLLWRWLYDLWFKIF